MPILEYLLPKILPAMEGGKNYLKLLKTDLFKYTLMKFRKMIYSKFY